MVRQLIEQQRATRYADFVGAAVRGRIPIPEAVINDLLSVALIDNSVIHDLHVILHGDQVIEVSMTVHKWIFHKRIVLDLVVEPLVVFAHSPTIRLWLPQSHHVLRSAAHLLTTVGGWLPRGVRVSGRLLEIDLGEILYDQNLPELVEWLQFMAIEGHRGMLLVFVEFAIDGGPRRHPA